LEEAYQLAEDTKAERDLEKVVFKAEKKGLLRDLKQTHVPKVEVEKVGD